MLNKNYDLGSTGPTKIIADIRDAGDAISWMSNICGPHELKVHNANKMHFRHIGNVLNSTTTAIGHIEYGTDVTVKVEDLNNSYSISLPVSGFQELDTGDNTVQSNVTSGVIISPGQCLRAANQWQLPQNSGTNFPPGHGARPGIPDWGKYQQALDL